MILDTDDLVSIGDIAKLTSVHNSAVVNWRHRKSGFPKPVWRSSLGDFYSLAEFKLWYRATWPDSVIAREWDQ
jgi:hypothetical protein